MEPAHVEGTSLFSASKRICTGPNKMADKERLTLHSLSSEHVFMRV
jgi:hypothetical protein